MYKIKYKSEISYFAMGMREKLEKPSILSTTEFMRWPLIFGTLRKGYQSFGR